MFNCRYCFILIIVLVLSACSGYRSALDNNEKVFLETFLPQRRSKVISPKSLHVILTYLKKKDNLEEKITSFVEKYGYPLWDYAVSASTENGEKNYVPIYKEGQKVISCIWVFETEKDTVKEYVRIMYPKDYRPKYTWMFDYYTVLILKEKPLSRLRFEPVDEQDSKCVRGSVVVVFSGEEITIDTRIFCWGDDMRFGQTENSGF